MKETNTTLLQKAEDYVTTLFKEELSDDLLYHNYAHTIEVVEVVSLLGEKSELSDEEVEMLKLAAWFHDTGYVKKYVGHEEESLKYADDFLQSNNFPKNKLEEVKRLINSTKYDQNPHGLLEEIMHDADLSHMGRKRFFRKGELLRVELETYLDEKYTELDWEKKQYKFLISNNFLTEAAKQEYGKRRVKNIKKQRKNIVKAQKVTTRVKTGKDFGRGIDTLYRANYRNHINLSAIADGKANMMISINTIMISVIVTLSGASLSMSKSYIIEHLRFTVPIFILLLGSLASVVFAVLSARPKVTTKNIVPEKVEANKMSLLYFGNFLKIPKKTFVEHLNKLKGDQEKLYDSMSVDLYNLGAVLQEKYRLLSISYNIFMGFLTATVVAFILIFVYTNAS